MTLADIPERLRFPAEVPRVISSDTKTRISFSERPQFEKQIKEERRLLKHTHVHDDWFVLLDFAPRKPGILPFFDVRLARGFAF